MDKESSHSDQDVVAGESEAQPDTAAAPLDSDVPSDDDKLRDAFRELKARDAQGSEEVGGSPDDASGTKEDTGSSDEQAGSPTKEGDDLSEAERNALHRWNWSDEYIESLSSEYVKKRAQKALKSQAVTDKALSDKAALEKQNQELQDRIDQILEERGLPAGAKKDEGTSADLDSEVEAALKDLESEDDLKPAAKLMRRLAADKDALERRLEEFRGKVDQTEQQTAQLQDDIAFTNARSRLSKDLPELQSDEVHSRIIQHAYKLAEADTYVGETDGAGEIYEDAARMVIKQVRAEQAQSQSQSYTHSQPSPGGGKSDGADNVSTLTSDDAMRSVYRDIKSGKTPEEAKARLRGAQIT